MYETMTIELAFHYYESFGVAFVSDGDSKTVDAEQE